MLKFAYNALIQQNNCSDCSRNRHTKHRPTMFYTATVRPRRWGPRILYNTPLRKGSLTLLTNMFNVQRKCVC